MTYLELQLKKCNLSLYEWGRICNYNLDKLREERGMPKKGDICIFEYSDMPIIGVIILKNKGKYPSYKVKFDSPFTDEELECLISERQIKIINHSAK